MPVKNSLPEVWNLERHLTMNQYDNIMNRTNKMMGICR